MSDEQGKVDVMVVKLGRSAPSLRRSGGVFFSFA